MKVHKPTPTTPVMNRIANNFRNQIVGHSRASFKLLLNDLVGRKARGRLWPTPEDCLVCSKCSEIVGLNSCWNHAETRPNTRRLVLQSAVNTARARNAHLLIVQVLAGTFKQLSGHGILARHVPGIGLVAAIVACDFPGPRIVAARLAMASSNVRNWHLVRRAVAAELAI